MLSIESIKLAGTIVSFVISAITLTGIIVKPVRARIISAIRDVSQTDKLDDLKNMIMENDAASREHDQQILENIASLDKRLSVIEDKERNDLKRTISNIYYSCLPHKKIPTFKHKLLIDSHSAYSALHGNTWEHEIYPIMMDWDVVSDEEWVKITAEK